MRFLALSIFILTLTFGCSSSKTATNLEDSMSNDLKKAQRKEDIKRSTDLTDRLKTFPGIAVRGSGSSATFTVRGVNSVSNSTEQPLFILDGVQLADYQQLYESVIPAEIKKIEVLRKTAETQQYGFRGNYGVIRITTDAAR